LYKTTVLVCPEIVKDEPGHEEDLKLAKIYEVILLEMKKGNVIEDFQWANKHGNATEFGYKEPFLLVKISFYPKVILKLVRRDEAIAEESKKYELYLGGSGLYRIPKNKYFCPIKINGKRYRIIKYFIDHKITKPYPTQAIANTVGYGENLDNFMREMGKFNKRIVNKLKLDEYFFVGEAGNGYKMNSKYIIKSETDG